MVHEQAGLITDEGPAATGGEPMAGEPGRWADLADQPVTYREATLALNMAQLVVLLVLLHLELTR